MITELEIQNFRGFKNLKLEGLRRVNLLMGGNDTGKTSVLEALVLLLGDTRSLHNLATAFRNNQAGGEPSHNRDDLENYWMWLFFEKDPKNPIRMSCQTIQGGTIQVRSLMQSDYGPPRVEAPITRRRGCREVAASSGLLHEGLGGQAGDFRPRNPADSSGAIPRR
jgi:hypothetical protein